MTIIFHLSFPPFTVAERITAIKDLVATNSSQCGNAPIKVTPHSPPPPHLMDNGCVFVINTDKNTGTRTAVYAHMLDSPLQTAPSLGSHSNYIPHSREEW